VKAVQIFNLTLDQMAMMFFLIIVGILLRAKKIVPENADAAVSRLLTYVFTPALTLYNQVTECTWQKLVENSSLILYGLIITLCAIAAAYPLSYLFVSKDQKSDKMAYRRNVYRYAMAFGNFGFVGNFIVLGVWGNEAFFKYSLFTFTMSIATASWGMYVLIPKERNAGIISNLKRGLITPPMIALVLGMAIALLNLQRYVPDFMVRAFESAGKCQGPAAMLLAGIVIGGYDFRELFNNVHVYILTVLRLIVIPVIILLVLRIIGASETHMIMALVGFAAPIGLNTVVYPAAYGGETKTGASMAMISHALCVFTIPLMYLVFIEMM